MPERKAIISYPGAPSIIQADYTLSHGIQPGLVVLVCNPQFQDLAGVGDVVLSDGVNTVRVPTCRIERADITFNTGEFRVTLRLLDRRWMWLLANDLNGHYNKSVPRIFDVPKVAENNTQIGNQGQQATDDEPLPDIQPNTKKDARALAEICLKKMGEKNYDIHHIPNNDYPEVDWVGANAAEQLQMLASRYGFRVVYSLDSDSVTIARLGEGADLPEPGDGESASQSLTIDPPEAPSMIVIYGDAIRYQVRFEMEAVGLDFDNVAKPISELSYRPSTAFGGWEGCAGPFTFPQTAGTFANALPGNRTYKDAKYLADLSVYRWYRIKNTLPKQSSASSAAADAQQAFWFPVDSKDYKDKVPRDHIELLPFRAEAAADDLGFSVLQGATCYGVAERGGLSYQLTEPGDEIRVPFEIDAVRQIIKFGQYMRTRRESAGKVAYYPATIILECCCHVSDKLDHSVRRYRYEYPMPGTRKSKRPPTDVVVQTYEDIKQWVRSNYIDAKDNKLNTTENNRPSCDVKAKYYAQGIAQKYQLKAPRQQGYNAVKPVYCDGAIQSVSWSVGTGGIMTMASRDSELVTVTQPFAVQQRQLETSLGRFSRAELVAGNNWDTAIATKIKGAIARDFGG